MREERHYECQVNKGEKSASFISTPFSAKIPWVDKTHSCVYSTCPHQCPRVTASCGRFTNHYWPRSQTLTPPTSVTKKQAAGKEDVQMFLILKPTTLKHRHHRYLKLQNIGQRRVGFVCPYWMLALLRKHRNNRKKFHDPLGPPDILCLPVLP